MPKHSTLESGNHQSQETRAHKHLLRSAVSPHLKKHGRRFWRSQASNPCRIQDGLHSVSSIVSAVAPRKSRHQRLHPPQFASPLSKVVAHRRQTTMASRLNIEKECFQSMRAVAQCACTVSDDNLFPTTNELKGGLVKTNIYKWSQCTCSRCQCTCSRQ